MAVTALRLRKDSETNSARQRGQHHGRARTAEVDVNDLRKLLDALKAARKGDFSARVRFRRDGLMGEIAEVFNDVMGHNQALAKEFSRVGRIVGREGKMTVRASLGPVGGAWGATVDAFNALIGDLVQPTSELARVITAVAQGDLSQKIPLEIAGRPVKGEFLRFAKTVNTMVDQLRSFAAEVTRVAKEVGVEGKLGGQAKVPGVAGTWKDLTDNVNQLAGNLTGQVRNIAEVSTAVANGDLSQKITVDARGEILDLKNTINIMVDQLRSFAAEVTRVAKEVGVEGKLGGQAKVSGVAGTWKDLTDNVNQLAGNLTNQVRNIALVTTAVAKGDLSQKITVDAKGEILELKTTINTMVDQLRSFAAEVTRVAKEVGTEGKLGGQAKVSGVAGTWKDLTENVNQLAGNLTNQVRNIALVTTAVANGDLSQKITVDARGEIMELKNTINVMVDQLRSFAAEVSRVAKEVGTEGKLGGQAKVAGVAGTWKDLTDNVNQLAGNLTNQVRNIALVTTAVANGDLSQKITVDAKGEIMELKNTINVMVDQLRSFAAEVTRVAKEVGTEGKLGGQAKVKGVSGTWKDLTDSVNGLAGNLTSQVRNIALVTTAVANGDLSQKITVDARGEILELKNTVNVMVDQLRSFAAEVTRVAKEVGTQGKLGGQAKVAGVAGTWKDLTDNVNQLAGNLTNQVRNIALVTTAVAKGDLSQKITVDAKGEIFELKNTINVMVDQLRSFAAEVIRVAKEVGTEGKLGGQAEVKGLAGTWKDLTENVNQLAGNLTNQVRNIALVTTAVAKGDLSRKITVDAKGEILELKNTINVMVDQLRSFAAEVTRVAKEVGVEGKLGGQAKVPGVAGTWKDLTDNVNQLASNLTTQVRAIAEVSTAVTKGDLTRIINVQARGEVLALKDNINQMIANLRETTQKNQEQDWLKTNIARFSGMMQGQKNLKAVSQLIMSELTPLVSAQYGAMFLVEYRDDGPVLELAAGYGYRRSRRLPTRFHFGEGLVGQCAQEKTAILLTKVPRDYVQIGSSLGQSTPANVLLLPVLFEGEVLAVIELASFQQFSVIHRVFLDQFMVSIGVVLNIIAANMRTEELLAELQHSNAELEAQAKELEEKAKLLQIKNQEVELASLSIEEKAEQLALISKYKSEFLANMSHELRTPLNSLLIMAKLLVDNKDGSLTSKQIEFAQTIYAAGKDLLSLINEILDLSKVEAGKMVVMPSNIDTKEILEYVERDFRPVAQQKGIGFDITITEDAPKEIFTDGQRLQQILKNLLSNAFKFTEKGRVSLTVARAPDGMHFSNEALRQSSEVLAFTVSDTGIGIAEGKQKLIFEAFQQVDATTSRKYGGTGLGLTISREIARLLGGEIHVGSTPGKGSTFTLYLRKTYAGPEAEPVPRAEMEDPIIVSRMESPIEFDGETVLVVDDDVRNIFAITSVLETKKLRVVYAENGRDAIDMLKIDSDIRLVLMDVMMPEMDGYETARAIRAERAFQTLPIVALTAKAMKGDREKCLEAGMSDYITKPVDTQKLFAMIAVWLDKSADAATKRVHA